jgi:hypothetical protein
MLTNITTDVSFGHFRRRRLFSVSRLIQNCCRSFSLEFCFERYEQIPQDLRGEFRLKDEL